jgi:predicted ATPase/DNA-binding SARP family transcriptional activator
VNSKVGKVTYRQQINYCGKPDCRRCREGRGHGPYWYAYQTVNGQTRRTYVGKQLPPDIQVTDEPDEQATDEFPSVGPKTALLRILVLGQFRLERRSEQEWEPVTDSAWQQRRVRALLGYLLSSPGRTLSRKQAMELLWPDQEREIATGQLDRAVHSLRRILEPARSRPATSRLLRLEDDQLILADARQIEVDADAFEDLLTRATATGDMGEAEQLLERAATLYGGDFLPEERTAEWAVARRQQLQQSRIKLLLLLADLRIAREALDSAIDPLDQLLTIDPTNEAAVQRLIVVLARLKRRGEAVRTYSRFASVLRQDYGASPSSETQALYEAVRRGEAHVLDQSAPTDFPVQSTGTSTSTPVEVAAPAIQVGRSHQSPLVGREPELEILRQLLLATEQATPIRSAARRRASIGLQETRQRSQCVLLMGEAGIGKTRLAEEVGREANQRGWAIAWSRVYAQESNSPYRLWTEALRNIMNSGFWQKHEISNRPLVYAPLVALLPELADPLPPMDYVSTLPPGQEQLRLQEATLQFLTTISDRMPLLVVLDDLQWADASSCELLAYLARHLQSHPLLLIGTCRESDLSGKHPLHSPLAHLQREQMVETLSIQPLTNPQIGTLITQSRIHLPEPIVQHIQTQAAGNPFFAEELARYRTQTVLSNSREHNGRMRSGSHVATLPETISAALDSRMSRLSSDCQQLLGNAAVLGGSFEFSVIRSVAGNSTPGAAYDEDTVFDLLEEALQAGVLMEEGKGIHITYSFSHPLLGSYLYERLSAARRMRMHRRAADIFQKLYSGREEEGSAIIAHHLLNGGAESRQIAHYAELAGNHAYTLSAYPEAERYYRLAVEHVGIPLKDEDKERLHLALLLERLAECTVVQGNFEEARHLYERVLEARHHQQTFKTERELEAQIDALLWCEMGWTWRYTGDNLRARQCYEHGEQVLQEAEVVTGPAWARLRYLQSSISWQEGNYEEARQAAREALKLFEEALQQQNSPAENASTPLHPTRIRRTLAGDPVDLGRTHGLLGAIANSAGQSTDALAHLNTALTIYQQYHRTREIAHVSCNLGYIYLKKAEHTLAEAALRRSLKLAEQIGDAPLTSVIFSNLGELAVRLGNLEEAETLLKRSLTLAERFNDRVYMSSWNASLSMVLQDQKKFAEAGVCIQRALSIGRAMKNIPCIGLALLAQGNMRIAQAQEAQGTSEENINKRFLLRARATLERLLALEGLEAETRTRGQLALAQVSLLLGKLDAAQAQALSATEGARQYELTWLLAVGQRLLENILATRA